MPRPKLEALIDGDIVVHRIAAAVEVETKWENDIWTLHADERLARCLLRNEVARIREMLGGGSVKPILCLSSSNNWRNTVLPTYKSNRKGNRKPVVYKALRAFAAEEFATKSIARLEADDVMGILATEPRKGKKRVIVTIDKDLKTVPGRHFNPDKDAEVRVVTEEQANYSHLTQALCGDSTDGYSGCPGIGPKKAEVILATGGWAAVVEAFVKAGLTAEDALIQARVARILRYPEFDFKTGEVILWNPADALF
jgi:DNA polymerase-1